MVTWTESLPPKTGAPADRAYIICATPRSGSTMLCGMLADAGAGWPASYFREKTMAARRDRLGLPGSAPFSAYLDAVRRAGSAGTRICGIRLMQENAAALLRDLRILFPEAPGDRALLEAALGEVRFIHLSRADKVAQAVSYIRARQSGLWHRGHDGSVIEELEAMEQAGYSNERIREIVETYEREDAAWKSWFAAEQISPVYVTYEAFSADPRAELRRILHHLRLDPDLAETASPATQPLADRDSQAWIERYRRETAS